MILTCPNCSTQYAVKDGAIPVQGRQVRCAACKHSWQQLPDADGGNGSATGDEAAPSGQDASATADIRPTEVEAQPPEGSAPEPEAASEAERFEQLDTDVPESAAERAAEADEPLVEATMIEPRSGPEAEALAYQAMRAADEAPLPPAEPEMPVASPDDEWRREDDLSFSPFAEDEDNEPRRARSLLPLLLVGLVIVATAIAFYFLAPDTWKARLGMAQSGASPLALVMTHMDRQRLESGNELLTVTGRVINPTGSEQPVPPLQAQLRAKDGRVVYRWTIAPPAQSLPAGASAPFNSAEVNVPPGGEDITLTLGTAQR